MRRALLLLLASSISAIALLAAGCGDGPDPTPTGTTAAGTATAFKPTTVPTKAGTPIVLKNATTTASGLQYTDEKVGEGASPRLDQSVTVHYVGKLAANGQVFDSSVAKGTPATFAMTGVIKGFSEAISTMKVGGKRTTLIPAALGYGARGQGPIPANADLIFEIELISIK